MWWQDSRQRKVALWVIALYVLVLSVTRTALKITKSVVLEQSIHGPQNTSELTADALVNVKQLKSGGHYRLTDVIYALLSTLHWIEYGLIIYGFYSFLRSASSWEKDFKKRLKAKVISHIMREHRLSSFITLLIILLFLGISLANPVLSIVHAYHKACNHQADISCNAWNEPIFRIVVVYQVFTIIAHLHISLIRLTMAIAVMAVYVIWFNKELCYGDEEPVVIANQQVAPALGNGVKGNETSEYCKAEWNIAGKTHYEHLAQYNKRREKIVPILDIYQQWFVVQWITYYFGLLTDLTHLLKPLVTRSEETLSTYSYIQISFYIVYSLLAFGIPYVCGLKMSVYHRKYRKELRKEQLSKKREAGLMQHALAHILTIEKHRECDFVPHIKWTGINIPIDGPGFTLCSILTILGFTAAIVGFS